MKPKIKAIIFDLGGVVAHGGYLDFIRHYCLKCMTPQGKREIIELERIVNLGLITERQFYLNLERLFGVHLKPRQMHELIVKRMTADKALLKVIKKLKLKPAKIAMFTNSIGHMARDVLKRRHIPARKLFTRVFDSSQLHMVKPDAVAYRYVVHKLEVKPREALMVDDRTANITGAKKIGMHGIVYKNSRQFQTALKKYVLV